MKAKTLVWILLIAAVILASALSFIGYEWRAMNIREQAARAEETRMRSERTVFNLAVAYEGRSLDAIRASMRSRSDILSARMTDAQRKLDTIHHASANVDMMNSAQVESLKSRIAATMAEKILEAGK